jgi:hypothetical protein
MSVVIAGNPAEPLRVGGSVLTEAAVLMTSPRVFLVNAIIKKRVPKWRNRLVNVASMPAGKLSPEG